MRDELRKKLDTLEKEDRLPLGWLLVAAVIGGLFFVPWWSQDENRTVRGVVKFAAPYVDTDSGQRGLSLQVELENGKLVNVGSFPLVGLTPPTAGTTIRLTERRSFTGFRSYVWAPPQ